MNRFVTGQAAKEFLVAKIVEEAARERVALSDIERKLLCFSETAWTLPDIMEVNAEFDRDYDQDIYEKKIAKLIRNVGKNARKQSAEEYKLLWSAVRCLRKEDHYILVMVHLSGLRPPGDILKLWGAGFAIVSSFALLSLIAIKYNIELDKYLSRENLFLAFWIVLIFLVAGYTLARWIFGAQKIGEFTAKVLETIFKTASRGH